MAILQFHSVLLRQHYNVSRGMVDNSKLCPINKPSSRVGVSWVLPKKRHYCCCTLTDTAVVVNEPPTKDDLINYLLSGCKPKNQWRYYLIAKRYFSTYYNCTILVRDCEINFVIYFLFFKTLHFN